MKVKKTIQYKIIKSNKNKKLKLNTTMRQYRRCVNFYLHKISQNKEMKDIYYEAKKIFKLPTALIQTTRDMAKEQYKSWKNNEDNNHFPHFEGFIPMILDKRTISFKKIGNEFDWWANISTIYGRIKVPITSCEEYLEKLNKDFKSVQVIYRSGEFYLNVIFEEEKEIIKEDKFKHFVGVDLGINNIATVVIQNRKGEVLETKFFSGKKLIEKRRRFSDLRKELGKKKLLNEIRKTKNRERNYIKDINHKISRKIIDMAKKYPNCCVVVEKLKGIRKKIKYSKQFNKNFHNWSFKELQRFIEYKAHNNSIAIRRVNPAYTSQVCRNCFSKMMRSSQSRTVCQTCKIEYNADWLGAVNITKRLFGYMLSNLGFSESSPKQGNVEHKGVTVPSFGESKGFVAQLSVS